MGFFCVVLVLSALIIWGPLCYAQAVFTEDWESGQEWSAAFKGVGEAEKGEVNGYTYCGHYNMNGTESHGGTRAGFFRVVSYFDFPGPPNESWAWRRVKSLYPNASYKLTFYASGDNDTLRVQDCFYAFGYTQLPAASYSGSGGVWGAGLPAGFDYPSSQSQDWFVDNQPNTVSMSDKLIPQASSWFKYEKTFVVTGTDIRLWGIAQNLDTGEHSIHGGLYVDDISLNFIGYPTNTPTPTQSQPTNTPTQQGCDSYRGDANCDGSITPGDALLAFNFFLGTSTPQTQPCDQRCASDADRSGSITPGDALCIFNKFLGTGDCI